MKPDMMVVLTPGDPVQTRAKALELVAVARQTHLMSGKTNPQIRIVLAGAGSEGVAEVIAGDSECAVTSMPLPDTACWDLLERGLETLVADIRPDLILFPHTAMAREVGPGLAVALGGVSISNVSAVDRDEKGFLFTRPVMDNTRTQAVRVPDGHLCVISLAPGAVVADGRFSNGAGAASGGRVSSQENEGGEGRVDVFHPPEFSGPGLKRIRLSSRAGGGEGKLSRAPIVVAAGRGIGDPENLARVKAFTACLPGAVTAASRPLVDQGWVGYDRQVGITGAIITPELYIALGISGSSQHLAGMAGSKWVVSVNHSPDAPICRHSDLCIQADVNAFMDAILENQAIE